MLTLSLGHLGHCFFGDPNDPKTGAGVRDGFNSLGHLGHLDTVLKSVREGASVRGSKFTRVYPYIKIFYFLN